MRVCHKLCVGVGFKHHYLTGVDKCSTCDMAFTKGQYTLCPCCGNFFRTRPRTWTAKGKAKRERKLKRYD